MKKHLLTILILILGLVQINGQELYNQRYKEQNVKKVSNSNGETFYYDNLGRLERATSYNETFRLQVNYTYNSTDSIIRIEESSFAPNSKLKEKASATTEYFYDNQGRKIEIITKSIEETVEGKFESISTTTFVYDSSGYLIQTLFSEPPYYMKTIYQNGSDNLPDTILTLDNLELSYNLAGNKYIDSLFLTSIFTYSYDQNGKLLSQIPLLNSNRDTYIYEYDQNGNLIKEFHNLGQFRNGCIVDSLETTAITTYKYENGLLVESNFEYTKNNQSSYAGTKYTYNKKGLLIKKGKMRIKYLYY